MPQVCTTYPANPNDFNFGNSDFTIEFRIKFNTLVGTANNFYGLIAVGMPDDNTFPETQKSWHFTLLANASLNNWTINFEYSIDGTHNVSFPLFPISITTGVWYHFVLIRSGADIYFFQNGVKQTTGSSYPGAGSTTANIGADSIHSSTRDMFIGAVVKDNTNPDEVWKNIDGRMEEIRISNIARWTANFTPPSSAYTTDANTLLLLHMDGTDGSTDFPDYSIRHKVTAHGDAQVDTSDSVFGGGSALFDGNGDYLQVEMGSSFIYCTGTSDEIDFVCGQVGVAISSMANLDHLEGETVAILANGKVLAQQVVTDGQITLNGTYYSKVHVGLPFMSDIETLNLDVNLKDGTIQGKKVKIGHVTFRLVDTQQGWIGPDEDSLYDAFHAAIASKLGDDDYEMFSGDIRTFLGAEYSDGGRIFYRNYDPTPVEISAVVPEAVVGGASG